MDPGSKVVQDNTYNVIIDLATRYEIDGERKYRERASDSCPLLSGIHFDDYFCTRSFSALVLIVVVLPRPTQSTLHRSL